MKVVHRVLSANQIAKNLGAGNLDRIYTIIENKNVTIIVLILCLLETDCTHVNLLMSKCKIVMISDDHHNIR